MIAAGDGYTCALASDEKVYCWGCNKDGQLGDGTTIDRDVPVKMEQDSLSNKAFNSISSGEDYSCAMVNDNKNYCWGSKIE